MNPPLWSMRAYPNAWTQWGLKGKPADYDRRFRARYGLTTGGITEASVATCSTVSTSGSCSGIRGNLTPTHGEATITPSN